MTVFGKLEKKVDSLIQALTHKDRKIRNAPVERQVETFMGKEVEDLRPDEEIRMERDAAAGVSLGKNVDELVRELIAIGSDGNFLGNGDGFDSDSNNLRVREIGRKLYDLGGHQLMLEAYYRVAVDRQGNRRLDPTGGSMGRTLEAAWEYIGNWLP